MKKFRQVLESVDPISENINKSSKELGKEINDAARKETGGDKKDFMNVSKLISQGKHKDAAKYMSKLDTAVLEDLVTFIMGHEDVFKVMYPKARPGQPVALFAREETEIVEAMSEKDKAKRLALIKKAVERINKGNAEKAKKDALAMMKASGMFDEDLDESTINEVSMSNSLEQAIEIEVDLGVTFDKGTLTRTDAEELKRDWAVYRQEIAKVVKPLGGLVTDTTAPNPRMTNTKGQRLGTVSIGTRGDASKLDAKKIKAVLSRSVDVADMKITNLNEESDLQEKITFYGSVIGGLKHKQYTYQAVAVDYKGKLGYKITNQHGDFETLTLQQFAKRFG